MENAVKALEIAAGVLIGVILMALIAYFFSSIGKFPKQQDDTKTTEQLSKFNLEYEVYDKKGMYGTDVISCLTKAQSNNEKYAKGGAYLGGSKYGDDYLINVLVKLNSDLTESIRVYKIDNNEEVEVLGSDAIIINHHEVTLKKAGFTNFNKKVTTFEEDNRLEKKSYSKEVENIDTTTGYTVLYDKNNRNTATFLQTMIIKFAGNNMKQVVYNRGEGTDKWSRAEWETVLYDFKTRRFKCDGIKYSDVTGRVNEIYFSELEH